MSFIRNIVLGLLLIFSLISCDVQAEQNSSRVTRIPSRQQADVEPAHPPSGQMALGAFVIIVLYGSAVSTVALLVLGRMVGLDGGFREAILASVLMFVFQIIAYILVLIAAPIVGPVYAIILLMLSLFVPGSLGIKVAYKVHFLNGLGGYFICCLVSYGVNKALGLPWWV